MGHDLMRLIGANSGWRLMPPRLGRCSSELGSGLMRTLQHLRRTWQS